MMKYGKAYGGADPELIEGDVFRIIVKYPDTAIYEEDSDVAGQVTTEVTPEVTPEVRLLNVLIGEMTRQDLQSALELKDDEHFRKAYLLPSLDAGLIEMTVPDKPRSSKQKYRLTEAGKCLLKSVQE